MFFTFSKEFFLMLERSYEVEKENDKIQIKGIFLLIGTYSQI
jgi:hypothetical protein